MECTIRKVKVTFNSMVASVFYISNSEADEDSKLSEKKSHFSTLYLSCLKSFGMLHTTVTSSRIL